jgi:hypothetical protein
MFYKSSLWLLCLIDVLATCQKKIPTPAWLRPGIIRHAPSAATALDNAPYHQKDIVCITSFGDVGTVHLGRLYNDLNWLSSG